MSDARNANFEISISKEELNLLEPEKFSGEIVVVEDTDTANRIVDELKEAEYVGFDTETKPSFKKGQLNQVALLQLATKGKCFLIRISKIGLPEKLKNYLESENYLKIGLSVKDDFHSLSKISNLEPKGFIDLQDYVKEFMISDCSLSKIHAIVFGTRISKSQQLSNWEAKELTKKQKEYAALDALACINIYKKLKSGDFIPQHSEYYKLKCQEEN